MTETRTRQSKAELVESVHDDLEEAAGMADQLYAWLSDLREDTRGINGLPSRCKAWADQLEVMAMDMREESADTREKLLGTGPKIETSVDDAHLSAVTEAIELGAEQDSTVVEPKEDPWKTWTGKLGDDREREGRRS